MSNTYLEIILNSPPSLSSDYIFNNVSYNNKTLNILLPAIIIIAVVILFCIGYCVCQHLPNWVQKIREYLDDWCYDYTEVFANTEELNKYSDINNV